MGCSTVERAESGPTSEELGNRVDLPISWAGHCQPTLCFTRKRAAIGWAVIGWAVTKLRRFLTTAPWTSKCYLSLSIDLLCFLSA